MIFVAVRFGARPALAASVAAFLAYNFFFTEPVYTLNVEHWHDLIALAVFVVVAGVTGTLAGRVRAPSAAGPRADRGARERSTTSRAASAPPRRSTI